MDKTSLKEYNRGKWNFVIFLLSILIFISVIAGVFTTYKQETLICIKSKNACYIEKTNLVNMKKKEKILDITQIAKVTYIPNKVSGNQYASGYTSYFLAFQNKNKELVKIFMTDYYEKEEIDKVIQKILVEIKDKNLDTLKIDRF